MNELSKSPRRARVLVVATATMLAASGATVLLAAPAGAASTIVVDKNSWSALQIGPAMPVAWIDDFGPNDALGFEL